MGWTYAPDSGGTKIPERTKLDVRYRLEQHAAKHYAGKYARRRRVRGQLGRQRARRYPLATMFA